MPLTIALLLAVAAAAPGAEVEGRVVGVHDGDTITLLLPEKEQVKIRLTEIDTPETGQPYGMRAKQALSEKVFGKEVRVRVAGQDRYGRLLGRVLVGDRDINRELVAEGHAWVYVQYVRDRSLFDVESEARAARRGLWALPAAQRQAPWTWRKHNRSRLRGRGQPAHSSTATPPGAATRPATRPASGDDAPERACDDKRTCGEMESCAEARFYLEQCGLSALDRDRDGVPCEALCR